MHKGELHQHLRETEFHESDEVRWPVIGDNTSYLQDVMLLEKVETIDLFHGGNGSFPERQGPIKMDLVDAKSCLTGFRIASASVHYFESVFQDSSIESLDFLSILCGLPT